MERTLRWIALLAVLLMCAGGALAQSDQGDQTQNALQKRSLNYEDANGSDAFGGIHRHGGDFVGDGGPHGPLGPGPDDELLKFLGMEDLIQVQGGLLFGFMSVYSYGPGGSQAGVEDPSPYGPNTSGSGFGPGGDQEGSGDCQAPLTQQRSHRR